MMQKAHHPNRLRALLREAGLTIREIHRETHIPESTLYYWAAGHGIIPKEDRKALAHVIGCSSHDLAPKYDIGEKIPYETASSEWSREMLIKRRELLHLLSVAGGALLTSDIDWNRIEASLTRPLDIDDIVVSDLEIINSRCWSLFMTASPKSSVLDGVLGQLKMQIHFLKEVRATRMHQRLCALTSSMSQLAGEIFFDLYDHATAQSCYISAASLAKEAEAFDLWASALVRYSYLPIFEGRYENAVPLLEHAESLAQRGDPALPTRSWTAATYAEAVSGIGNVKAYQSAFERAHHVSTLTMNCPAWVRFDESRLPALQGACYVRLGKPDQAEPILQKALLQSAKTNRRRAMILSDLALSALQQADIETACTYAEEAVTLAGLSESGFLRNNVLKIQQQLTPFISIEAVRALEQHIAALA
ncbi:MAG: helix-turn-helix transcriptional regulator [Ktedonobacteraceae bacterium]|nr:helix-turn-helix transcriptional regulator [Ktedonobacteraceae bacterium]